MRDHGKNNESETLYYIHRRGNFRERSKKVPDYVNEKLREVMLGIGDAMITVTLV